MAGSLVIAAEQFWGPATWVFRGVLRHTLVHLSSTEAPTVFERLGAGLVEERGHFVTLEGVPQEQLRLFLGALDAAYRAAEVAGAADFADPEFFSGFMEQFRELIALMRLHLGVESGGPS